MENTKYELMAYKEKHYVVFLIIILIVHFSLSIKCDISHSMIELIILAPINIKISHLWSTTLSIAKYNN